MSCYLTILSWHVSGLYECLCMKQIAGGSSALLSHMWSLPRDRWEFAVHGSQNASLVRQCSPQCPNFIQPHPNNATNVCIFFWAPACSDDLWLSKTQSYTWRKTCVWFKWTTQLQHKNFSVQEVSLSLLQSTSVAMYRPKGNTGNKAVEWHLN